MKDIIEDLTKLALATRGIAPTAMCLFLMLTAYAFVSIGMSLVKIGNDTQLYVLGSILLWGGGLFGIVMMGITLSWFFKGWPPFLDLGQQRELDEEDL